MVSTIDSPLGAHTRVPEYQLVIHRLRLSASPPYPTHPGKISLTQEPLVIRRKSFPLFIRYSCLHSHSHTLHTIKSPRCFTAVHDAPLPNQQKKMLTAAASAVYLSPTTLSAQNHSTSELLRTLSRMAASKPTSWLSSRSHILFHLVHPLALTGDLGCFPLDQRSLSPQSHCHA
ncbi:hypothetical protein FRC0190_02303 [Corynebacterium rouxii]|uniref:Uncharacterized protein n=1 Tax=Corynebacterium rouxii TaxID=2719119 RepID=A0A6I8MIU4_9CORY|nr:hypothetical protein FRC0190_02303 [Corynebacterium rouxii]